MLKNKKIGGVKMSLKEIIELMPILIIVWLMAKSINSLFQKIIKIKSEENKEKDKDISIFWESFFILFSSFFYFGILFHA